MTIAFIVRSTIFDVPGGDTVQIVKLAEELANTGVHVTIHKAHEQIEYTRYDLLHFFNITRPADLLRHAYLSPVPFVVSPIYIDYAGYDQVYRNILVKYLLSSFTTDQLEYIKTVLRWILRKDKLNSARFLVKGQRKSIEEILNKAVAILPATDSEFIFLQNKYRFQSKCFITPVGYDADLFSPVGEKKEDDLVLCVGRIEGIKNQLSLIRALNDTAYRLLLIGKPAPNQKRYYQKCIKEAAGNISFIDHLPQTELKDHYAKAKVHVLASHFENIGLASIEAAAMNCNLVISHNGFASEYLGEDVHYCDPCSESSIRSAIDQAARQPLNTNMQERIGKEFTWEKVALKTKEAYEAVLK